MERRRRHEGFTLIELSIVLVIIGLIVGGVLVGRDLVRASEVRATITQVEKYNQAVNAFRGKYSYLPGDIKDPEASDFGFTARGTCPGQGDGNGIIEGNQDSPGVCIGSGGIGFEMAGETLMFWADLSKVGLIDGSFTNAKVVGAFPGCCGGTTGFETVFPSAKLGFGNYFYVWSQGGINFYGLSAIYSVSTGSILRSNPGLTVQQASSIDGKTDDGFPQTGNVTAQHVNYYGLVFARGGGNAGAISTAPATTAATSGSSTTCFDNANSAGAIQRYSVKQNGGAGVNCALSFRFQ